MKKKKWVKDQERYSYKKEQKEEKEINKGPGEKSSEKEQKEEIGFSDKHRNRQRVDTENELNRNSVFFSV